MMAVDLQFPAPKLFDCLGKPGTTDAAAKVLEEAAELVEAVKRCVIWHAAEPDTLFPTARESVIDEAMDVYQALVNCMGWDVGLEIFDVPVRDMDKQLALDVLNRSAMLFASLDFTRYEGPHEYYALAILRALAVVIASDFFNEEVIAAYARCKERNRMRGRYEDCDSE